MANERIHEARLSDRVTCIQGDYCDIPSSIERADVAYAIESFVHAPAPHLVFAACARLIRPQGLLVICDDFRRAATDQAAARAIGRFRRGWHINTLLSREELRNIAQAAGFDHEWTLDLSQALEMSRTRDRAIKVIAAVADWIPFAAERVDYLLGGAALQVRLMNGWIGYDLAVFRKRERRSAAVTHHRGALGEWVPTAVLRNVADTGKWSDTSPRPSRFDTSRTSADSSIKLLPGS